MLHLTHSRLTTSFRALALAIALVTPPLAFAQDKPPVRFVIPAPPGGSLDANVRLIASRFTVLTGEPHIVENRPGANSQIAAEAVLRAPADGRTLLVAPASVPLLPLLQKIPFSLDDFAPVVQLTNHHYVLVALAGSTIPAARELEAEAARRTGGISCLGSQGPSILACDQLKMRTGGAVVSVPFSGLPPALNALLGGHGDVMFAPAEGVQKLVEAGKLRVIARSTTIAGMAHVPLASDVWPGLVLEGTNGLMVSAKTPPARVMELNRELNQVLADPEVVSAMSESGQELVAGPPERYGEALRRSSSRYARTLQRLKTLSN